MIAAGIPAGLGTLPISLGDAGQMLRDLSDPTEYTKVRINQAARRTGLPYWRVFDVWYRKARRLEQFERDAIARALEEKQDAELRNELHALRLRLTRLESLLVQKNPTMDRDAPHPARPAHRQPGGLGRAVAAAVSK